MSRLLSLGLLLLSLSHALAEDWPQWLGPRRDGSTSEKVVPWKGDLQVVWKHAVGEGNSSPVVAGERVYLHTRVKNTTDEMLSAYAAKDGTLLWSKTYDRDNFLSLFGNGPRATPAIKEGKIYTYGITGLLTCFDAVTGKQLWQVNALKTANHAKNLFFGASSSPLLEGSLVVINPGGPKTSLAAYHRGDGYVEWQKHDYGASYASPIAVGDKDKRQLIFLTAKALVSVNPDFGKVYWDYPMVDKFFESSTTPVVNGDILFASSITYGGVALKMSQEDDKPNITKLWDNPKLTCYFSTPVSVGNYFYVVTGTTPALGNLLSAAKKPLNQADLHCVEAGSGKILWTKAKVGTYHASLTRTGDDKLLLLEEAGQLVLVDPNPDEYRELARGKICGNSWAHPALANGCLFVRDGGELVCVRLSSSNE